MAWLPVTFWCRRCWWKKTLEWYCENYLIEDLAEPLQILSLKRRRSGYKAHRQDKPNCNERRLRFVVHNPKE